MVHGSSRHWRAWVLAGLLLLAAAADASAHAGSMAFWRVACDGDRAHSEILLALDDVSRFAPEVAAASGAVPVERLGAFGETLLAHFTVRQDGLPVPSRIVTSRVLPSGLLEVQVVHQLTDPARPLTLRATFHAMTDETHRVIGRVDRRDVSDSIVLDVSTPEHLVQPASGRSWRDAIAPEGSVRAMLLLGIEHILTGYDHLLFLGCLLVPGGGWRSRVAIVSAFTVAHSLTLVLAAMRVVTPPPQFVEPAIALSIGYVAVENLVADRQSRRWPTAFGFGLIHGFGFAGMLDVLDLPLSQWLAAVAAFNLGVEIGQLAVVAVAVPLIVIVARSPWHRRVVQCTSVFVLGLAVVWIVERLP